MSLIACPGASVSEPAQGAGLGDKLSQGTSVPLPTTLMSICCPREPPTFNKPMVWIYCVLGPEDTPCSYRPSI